MKRIIKYRKPIPYCYIYCYTIEMEKYSGNYYSYYEKNKKCEVSNYINNKKYGLETRYVYNTEIQTQKYFL